MKFRPLRCSLLTALTFGLAAPAMAQPGPPPPPPGMPPLGTVDAGGHFYGNARPDNGPDQRPEWHGDYPGMPGGYDEAGYQQARADWLGECRRNHGNGSMVGAAAIGGLVGGVIGNRVAGRGNRVIGTVAGAAVGAVAGGAIGSAADRRSARDYCESYLERYTTWQGGPGYAPAGGQRECTTTVVTEEYVTETPQRHTLRRMIPRRVPVAPRAPVHDKRVRIN